MPRFVFFVLFLFFILCLSGGCTSARKAPHVKRQPQIESGLDKLTYTLTISRETNKIYRKKLHVDFAGVVKSLLGVVSEVSAEQVIVKFDDQMDLNTFILTGISDDSENTDHVDISGTFRIEDRKVKGDVKVSGTLSGE